MKTIIKIIAAVLVLGTINSKAQSEPQPRAKLPAIPQSTSPALPSIDIYGLIPVKYCGGGFGLNMLSKPFTIGHWSPTIPVEIRFGGDFYWSQLNHHNLGEVPLSSPQIGNATVRLSDNVYGLNAMTRLSFPWSAKITPYVDIFAGLRGFSAGMDVTPDSYQRDYQKSTSQNLSSIAQFNYGITGGIMVSLGKSAKLNLGLMYSYSEKPGEIVNINSAHMESGGIVADNMSTPKGMLLAKVGFTFLLNKSNPNGCRSCGCRSGYRSGGYRSGGSFFRGGGGGSNHVNFNFRPSR
jgi:hypothetical protein